MFNVVPAVTTEARASLYGFKILSPISIAFAVVYFAASLPKYKLISVNPVKLLIPLIGFV